MSARRERQSAMPGFLATRTRGVHYDEGSVVPALGTVGYAPGGIFLLTVSPPLNGGLYVNNGTYASSNFQLFVSMTGVAPVIADAVLFLVTASKCAGRTTLLSRTGAVNMNVSLPSATGTGDRYRFVVGIVPTNPFMYSIQSGQNDGFFGSVGASARNATWNSATNGKTFQAAGNPGGIVFAFASRGAIGDWAEIEDVAVGVWQIQGWLTSNTNPTTPFS